MITLELLRDVLAWCSVVNLGILLLWFLLFAFAHGWLYRLHGRWFNLKLEVFDATHYAGMTLFVLGILLFNLVPYVTLRAML